MDEFAASFNPTICVTHKCNLSCVYCYQSKHESMDITEETARKCIDDIMKSVPAYVKRICISFIGGEPLLKLPLIKE